MARIARKPTTKRRTTRTDDSDIAVGIEPAKKIEEDAEEDKAGDEPKPPRSAKVLEAQLDDDEEDEVDADDAVASLHLPLRGDSEDSGG
jgi:hypothetical protein